MPELTMTASTIAARLAVGDLKAATVAEILTLLGIEAGATADQTGAEIKTAYEANANSNEYSDAEQITVLSVENNADVTDATNVAAAGAIMDGDVFIGNNVLTAHKNLVIIRPLVITVDIDVDEINLEDSSNVYFRASSVNLTTTITTSGVNGLDTGAEAASTWYHLWVIYNGTTVASLMSLSSTAPTLPSGYTFKGYVGAVFNDSGSDLVDFNQIGNLVIGGDIAVLIDGSATTPTSIDLSAEIPTTAIGINAFLDVKETVAGISNGALFADSAGVRFLSSIINNGTTNRIGYQDRFGPLLTAQTIWYKVVGSTERLRIIIRGFNF